VYSLHTCTHKNAHSFLPRMKRPVTIDDMKQRLANFRSAEAIAACNSFEPRNSDVFISTYSKSGTTWLQHVVHQLRSDANIDFSDISAVVPWLESAVDVQIDPNADQPGAFRAFKCHLLYRDIPKGGRYITVFRDPETVLPSFYRFFEGWWFETGSISIEDFARQMYMHGSAAGRHWDHLTEWWQQGQQPNTLVLCYEDMLQAPESVPAVVAEFLGLQIEATLMEKVVYHTSRDYMLNNQSKFEEHLLRQHRDAIWGLPAGGDTTKVKSPESATAISTELASELGAVWKQTVETSLGFTSYQEFRQSLPNPLGVDRKAA